MKIGDWFVCKFILSDERIESSPNVVLVNHNNKLNDNVKSFNHFQSKVIQIEQMVFLCSLTTTYISESL